MAGPDTNPVFAAWGSIQQAVSERASTADVWAAVRSALAPEGGPLPTGSFQIVNQLRGMAAGIRNAASNLAASDLDSLIQPNMVSQNINSRDLLQQALAPQYEIRYQATLTTEEGATTRWFTAHVSSLAGMTKGDLISQLAFGNTLLSEDYGGLVEGVDNIQISAI